MTICGYQQCLHHFKRSQHHASDLPGDEGPVKCGSAETHRWVLASRLAKRSQPRSCPTNLSVPPATRIALDPMGVRSEEALPVSCF